MTIPLLSVFYIFSILYCSFFYPFSILYLSFFYLFFSILFLSFLYPSSILFLSFMASFSILFQSFFDIDRGVVSLEALDQTPKPKEILFFVFFSDFPQIFRGKFADDVEQKCCQGCKTISIFVMIVYKLRNNSLNKLYCTKSIAEL